MIYYVAAFSGVGSLCILHLYSNTLLAVNDWFLESLDCYKEYYEFWWIKRLMVLVASFAEFLEKLMQL